MITTTPRRSSGAAAVVSRAVATGAMALGLAAAAAILSGTARAQVASSVTGGVPSLPVATPSVLPATGTSGYRVGDLRDAVSSLLASGPLPFAGPAWIVTPSLGIDVGVTDNALEVSSPRRADVFTDIYPNITITGDTRRLQVNASYSPVVTLFAQTPGRNAVSQYLSGDAFATVVPDLFYVDLRANITQSSITGGYGGFVGYGPSGSSALNGQDQVQSSSVAVTPYLLHRFDGWGTGTLSYSLAYTVQSGYGVNGNTTANAIPFSTGPYSGFGVNPAFLANQYLLTNSELAQFTTGENLGRTNLTGTVSLQQYSGNGIYGGNEIAGSGGSSYDNLYTLGGAYALTRSIAPVAEIGYEDLRYASVPVVEVSSPVWYAGVRWTPNPDSTVMVGYGRRDGINSAYLDASYAPTARTRIYATYSSGLTSAAQDQQALLQTANFSPGAQQTNGLTSGLTGAPLITTGNAFGTQNALYRAQRLTVTAVLLRPRDAYTIGLVHEVDTVIAGSVLLNSNGTYGGTYGQFSWQHDLSPAVSTNLFLQYGTNTTQLAGQPNTNASEQFYNATATVSYAISQSLTSYASYLLSGRFGSAIAGRNYVENIGLVGLRKGF